MWIRPPPSIPGNRKIAAKPAPSVIPATVASAVRILWPRSLSQRAAATGTAEKQNVTPIWLHTNKA